MPQAPSPTHFSRQCRLFSRLSGLFIVVFGVCQVFGFGVFLMSEKADFGSVKAFKCMPQMVYSEKEAIWTTKTSSESVCILTKI